jgi:DNA-binding transcriptional LysR family regulator
VIFIRIAADIQAGRLMPLLPNYQALEVSIYLVYPQRRHLLPKVRAFADFMAEKITEAPCWGVAKGKASAENAV